MFERKSARMQPQSASSSSKRSSDQKAYPTVSSKESTSTVQPKGYPWGDDEDYESDGNLSIPASFTRTTAALNLGFESDFDDDESLSDLSSAKSNKKLQGEQTIAESWDDDFIFTSTGDSKGETSSSSQSSKGIPNLIRDNFSEEEEISNWDSEGSESSVKALGPAIQGQSGKNRLFRTASTQTIVPDAGQVEKTKSSTPKQALTSASKTSDSNKHEIQPASQPESSTQQPIHQSQPALHTAQPTTPTSKKRWPLSKNSHKLSPQKAVLSNSSQPASSKLLSNDQLLHSTGQEKTYGTLNKAVLEENISKRKSFGLGEKTWSKILQSKLHRRKEQSASVAERDPKQVQIEGQTQLERLRKQQTPEKVDAERKTRAESSSKSFPTITEKSTIRANELTKSSNQQMQESPSSRQMQSRPSLPGAFEKNARMSQDQHRSPSREEYGPLSEHRQWASRLNKESPPRRIPARKKSEGSNHASTDSAHLIDQSEEKKNGKRKMETEEIRLAQGFAKSGSPTHSNRPTRAMPSESLRRDHSLSAAMQYRSASDSTSVSIPSSVDYDKLSMNGSNLTDTSIDTSVAAPSSKVTHSHTPKIQIVRQVPSDVESLPSSTDSRLSRARRPPPVSSGIESLTRRQAAIHLKEMSSHENVTSQQESVEEQNPTRSDSRNMLSRNDDVEPNARFSALGDLKIPSRISKAQEGVRADMMRIRNFATGIEELKGLRDAYHRILDRFDHQTEEDSRPNHQNDALRIELEHSEYIYGSWWECAEVLIGLADGKGELENTSEEQITVKNGKPYSKDQTDSDERFSTVRRMHNDKSQSVANSRASSSASRYVHPERERDILAAMLAGTPPEQSSPSKSSIILPRYRTTSVDAPTSRDSLFENRTIRDNRRMSSHSMIVQTRKRTSDPDSEKEKGKQKDPNLQQLPLILGQNSSNPKLDHPKNNRVIRQTSGGRRHLRSAGQQGLQGLKDLIITIRRNSTTTNCRDEAHGSQLCLQESMGESIPAIDGKCRIPSREMDSPQFASSTGTSSPLTPDLIKLTLQRPTARLPKSSGSYDADAEKSTADVRPSRRFIRFARASSSSSAFSFDGSGQESSLDSTWTEADLSLSHSEDVDGHFPSHTFDSQPSKTISNSHRRTISMLTKALPTVTRKNDRLTDWNGFSSSNNLRLTSNAIHRQKNGIFGNLRNNRSEAHLASPSQSIQHASAPPLPRTMSEEGRVRSPDFHESGGGKSSESDWTLHEASTSNSLNRMRVISADHLDLAAQKQAEEASEAFRKMAMRSEAMPSLNRYLDATRSRCRESLTMLRDLEGQLPNLSIV